METQVEISKIQFTLVSTVFNEISRMEQTIADIGAQSLSPDQIVVTDAGSTDGTYERLLQWKAASFVPIVILQEKGCNVARGRNLSIQAAKNDLILSTDFGCRFHPEWLESLIMPFQLERERQKSEDQSQKSKIEIVGGAFTVREEEICTIAARADYILQRGYPVVMDEYFSVSSRSIAYYKEVWRKVGGYPEWLTLAADDTIFWRLIKKEGFNYRLIDKPYVYWGRHITHKAFAREAFRYGLGDGESHINYRNFWSHLIETSLRYGFLLSIILILLVFIFAKNFSGLSLFFWFIPLLFIPGLRSYINAWKGWRPIKSKKFNFTVFLHALFQLEISRIGYLKGYIKGLSDRAHDKQKGRLAIIEALGK